MWLQHRLGHSALGNDETPAHLPTQKTIEFSPNNDLQQSTKPGTIVTESSFTDTEAAVGGDGGREGNSTLESKELLHAQ